MTTTTTPVRRTDNMSDVRLTELCTRMAASPTVFGNQAAAWGAAAASFKVAHRIMTAQVEGSPERADEIRRAGFDILARAGLRIEQAITGHHEDTTTGTSAPPPVAQMTRQQAKALRISEYTARVLYLRAQADGAPPHFAERASVQYGAAACYERAVKEWNFDQFSSGETWMRAAEQMLANAVVPAPWHPTT